MGYIMASMLLRVKKNFLRVACSSVRSSHSIGIDVMQKNRGTTNIKDLTNGPGKLTQAFKITKALNDVDLIRSETFFLADNDEKKSPFTVKTSPRIGISKAKDTLWRFYIQGNPFVSYHKKLE